MSTTLNDIENETTNSSNLGVAQRLQEETTLVRLRIRWPGIRKTLSESQKRQAASTFESDTASVSASKKLLDTSHPAFRAATAVKTQAVEYWKGNTLPYIEPGVRLIRRHDLHDFDVYMTTIKTELAETVEDLERHYHELVDQARERLGHLFDADDYASQLSELFAIAWDYPCCSPPDYLLQVSPRLYDEECQRVRTRFDEAVHLAEHAFAEELAQMVSHLSERLRGDDDGKPKIFRDTAVTNLVEFFDRFQRLNIRSDEQLDQLVEQARDAISGVAPQDLRDHEVMRQQVSKEMNRVEAALEGWMTNRPRRNILRRPR